MLRRSRPTLTADELAACEPAEIDPAEIELDEPLVRQLLSEQHEDLAGLPLHRMTEGYDHALWRLGGDLALRLPRRPSAARLIVNEQRFLPQLAPVLPLPVPVPVRVGLPSPAFPWPWSVLPWLDGIPASRTPVREGGGELGGFLSVLHGAHGAGDAPYNPRRSGALAEWSEHFERRLASLGARLDAARLRRVWAAALDAGAGGAPSSWIHGDLQPSNVLIRDGRLAAIIDWSDLCAGDPATDLAAFWMLLPASELPAFTSVYGDLSDEMLTRSLAWALLYGLMYVDEVAELRQLGEEIVAKVLASQPFNR